MNDLEYNICEFIIFADHHPYTISDMLYLLKLKDEQNAILITTAKDWLRLPQSYRSSVEVLPIVLEFNNKSSLSKFIDTHLAYVQEKKNNLKVTRLKS